MDVYHFNNPFGVFADMALEPWIKASLLARGAGSTRKNRLNRDLILA